MQGILSHTSLEGVRSESFLVTILPENRQRVRTETLGTPAFTQSSNTEDGVVFRTVFPPSVIYT